MVDGLPPANIFGSRRNFPYECNYLSGDPQSQMTTHMSVLGQGALILYMGGHSQAQMTTHINVIGHLTKYSYMGGHSMFQNLAAGVGLSMGPTFEA